MVYSLSNVFFRSNSCDLSARYRYNTGLLCAALLLIFSHNVLKTRSQETEREIPNFIHICQRSDSKLSDCISQSVMDLRPYLKNGIEELNVPPIEPLFINQFDVSQAGGVHITATDVKVYGCSDFTITWLRANFDDVALEFGLDLPMIYVESLYKMEGRIFLVPVYGSGSMTGNFTNCKANVAAQGGIVQRDGRNYLQFSEMQISFRIRRGNIHLDNLFGQQEALGKVVNNAINNNFQLFVRQLQPSIEKALSNVMFNISNNVLSSFTYEELFPL